MPQRRGTPQRGPTNGRIVEQSCEEIWDGGVVNKHLSQEETQSLLEWTEE